MMPPVLRATAWEYRHRYLIHGLIYTVGLAAPWQLPVWGFLRNGSSWFLASNALAKPTYQNFAFAWNGILVVAILFALVGAVLRTWGAAYLGAATVHQGAMEGDRVIAAGPYRYTRNPLYLGTICNSVAVAMLMRPTGAILTLILITIVQFRLIGREEPYLADKLGPSYTSYLQAVPRLVPSPRPLTSNAGARPDWRQGLLSEVYVIGCVLSFGAFGWTTGYAWEGSVLHVLQGIVISLGCSVVARAFIPRAKA